jgi:hypothetical protein
MSIPEKEPQKRLKLYNRSMTDKKIGKIIDLTETVIRYWRKRNNLTSNYKN